MNRIILIFLVSLPFSVIAEEVSQGVIDNREGGFFDSEVTERGFFDDDRTSFPIKNDVGQATRLKEGDSWDIRGAERMGRNTLRNIIRSSVRPQSGLLSAPPPPPLPPLPPLPDRAGNSSLIGIR